MGFIDSYKRLEKLCGEVLNDNRCVSAYIDEMLNTPNGAVYVRTWNEDLKKLKHYRWVRNQISHEPGCNEFNMCEPGDELWIENFYLRIMNQTDPLALYRKAIVSYTTVKPKQTQPRVPTYTQPRTPTYTQPDPPTYRQPDTDYRNSTRKTTGCAAFFYVAVVIVVAVVFYILFFG